MYYKDYLNKIKTISSSDFIDLETILFENKYRFSDTSKTNRPPFSPVYELMRFFTPFGVSHFNDRLALKGKTWQDSVIYRQDISEFLPVLSGKEVYIGTYIGNYDKGGHKVSLEMSIHPGGSKLCLYSIRPM